MRKMLDEFIKTLPGPGRGQSLVEIAVLAPLAIFMLIGVFEVGWALRSYLILVNVNREATRFAVRPGYLDYSTASITDTVSHSNETIGYNNVLSHANTSLGDQLELDFETNSTLIISHLYIETGFPCHPEEDIADCDCNAFLDPGANFNISQVYTMDDKILHPDTLGKAYYVTAFPTHTLTSTLLNYEELAAERARENNKFNCELLKKGGDPSINEFIATEMTYDHPQLLGFPFISNPLTDPIPLYTHTVMRLAPSARNDYTDTVGPVCEAYPIIVKETTIEYGTPNKIGHQVDIFDGNGPNDFGWLAWNPANNVSNNRPYLRDELRSAHAPLNDFTNARDPADRTLSVGDWVASYPGVVEAVEASDEMVRRLVGQKIRIPVWDTFDTGGRDAYHIIGFAWVRIEAVDDINLPHKEILATYLGDAADACRVTTPGP